jgi:glyoxylase I family protein
VARLTMNVEAIGIDHIYLAVSNLERSQEFYDRVLPMLGFRKNTFLNEGDRHVQYYNRHFGFVLRPARTLDRPHDPLAPGLHHFCFRVEDKVAVDTIAKRFRDAGVVCSEPQLYPEYAPDYYAIFFSDPDSIRLEVTNYRAERRERFEKWHDTKA